VAGVGGRNTTSIAGDALVRRRPEKARAADGMLMGLRGTPFSTTATSSGWPDTHIPKDRVLDPVGLSTAARMGRDAERTPMPCDGDSGGVSRPPAWSRGLPSATSRHAKRGRAARRRQLDALAHS